ncbi:MAG: hypothetical protein BWY21_00557 [Parcubacteria group bacterium ADurb.Bin216]|nr:MAG: hypothetical protein BWY21_00557 [Parcubacteria group bacterium ADurb.Bin216]
MSMLFGSPLEYNRELYEEALAAPQPVANAGGGSNSVLGQIGNALAGYLQPVRVAVTGLGNMMNANNQALPRALGQVGQMATIYGNEGKPGLSKIANMIAAGGAAPQLNAAAGAKTPGTSAAPIAPTQNPQQQSTQPTQAPATKRMPTLQDQLYAALTGVGNSNVPFFSANGDMAVAPAAPVVTANAPFVRNSDTVTALTPQAQALQDVALSLGPDALLDVWNQGPVRQTAETAAYLAPSQAMKDTATANKMAFEMSPAYVQHTALLEHAKKTGDLFAQRQHLLALASLPENNIPIDNPLLNSQGIYTAGQLMLMTGETNPSAITALINSAATVKAAGIRAQGDILADQIAMINQARQMKAQIEKRMMIESDVERALSQKELTYWDSILKDYSAQHEQTIKILGGSPQARAEVGSQGKVYTPEDVKNTPYTAEAKAFRQKHPEASVTFNPKNGSWEFRGVKDSKRPIVFGPSASKDAIQIPTTPVKEKPDIKTRVQQAVDSSTSPDAMKALVDQYYNFYKYYLRMSEAEAKRMAETEAALEIERRKKDINLNK